MIDRQRVITALECCKDVHQSGRWASGCISCGYADKHRPDCFLRLADDAVELLKEQEAVVRCKDCENWIPGYITDHDDFIPPKCGKYQQMVGHSADGYCSLAERKEGR